MEMLKCSIMMDHTHIKVLQVSLNSMTLRETELYQTQMKQKNISTLILKGTLGYMIPMEMLSIKIASQINGLWTLMVNNPMKLGLHHNLLRNKFFQKNEFKTDI